MSSGDGAIVVDYGLADGDISSIPPYPGEGVNTANAVRARHAEIEAVVLM